MKRLRSPKAFVLIVALLLAVATAAVAVSLQQGAGSAIVAVTHSNAGEQARALAEVGLARAESYAMTVSRNRTDFDKVLDPNNEANCSLLDAVTDSGVVAETGDMYLPRFTDTGASIVTFEGLRWRSVPYNGGAYLVRYTDNFDDGVVADGTVPTIDWSTSTSNNFSGAVGTATFCAEGPTIPTAVVPGINGVNNPARDRDRTIVASVIGIYPGTDPVKAKHRAMLSRVIFDGRVRGPVAMRIGGSIDIDNGSQMQFCSELSGVSATGIIDSGPPGSCGCGTVQATTVDLTSGDCGACCGSNSFTDVDGASQPLPAIPLVRAANWYDYTSYCNFYMDDATSSFFYWDAEGTRGATSCSTYVGVLPPPDTTGTTIGSCWVPLWKNTGGVFTVPLGIDAGANDEIVKGPGCAAAGGLACAMEWQPKNAAVAITNIGSSATAPANYYTAAATVNVKKPNWATECPKTGSASDFRWNPPQPDTGGGEEVACSTCNGTVTTWQVTEGGDFQMANNARAYPTGVYFNAGNLNVGFSTTVPGAQRPLATNAWPMVTLIVEGNLTTSNSTALVLGAGTRKKDYPSLVVSGNFTTNNATQVHLAGSLFVRGNIDFDHGNAGGSTLYGRVEVLGNLHTSAGSRLNWDYDVDLFDATSTRQAARVRLSTPLGF